MSENILVSREGPILVVTLNRPERYNALTRDMLYALGAAFKEAGEDPEVRVVLMLANGKAFCSGADAEGLSQQAEKRLADPAADVEAMPLFTARHVGIFKPVVVAINGICAGAGLHFVADSEVVISSTTASFTDTHVNVGQVTALEPIGLSRRMPLGTVTRMVVLGKAERLSAQRAYELGMVSELVEPEKLRERAYELARIISEVSPQAVQTSLKAIWRSTDVGLTQAYEEGFDALVRHRDHADAKEGPQAFMQKRPPAWSVPRPWKFEGHVVGNRLIRDGS